jgi:C4-dicarboxylate-specific signal transduction histidine kinase
VEKARTETNTIGRVSLCDSPVFKLEVSDTGTAIRADIAERLFKSHVTSKSGLGVGLYHAAQQAKQAGYTLSLVENEDGNVRFRIEAHLQQQ